MRLTGLLIVLSLVLAGLLIWPEKVWAQSCADKGGFCAPSFDCHYGSWGKLDCTGDDVCCRSSAAGEGDIFGKIKLPGIFKYGELTKEGGGLILFLNNIIRLLIVVGGIFAFFNLILAGYGFMSAGDDPKAMGRAWQKIWQSMMGLLFILGSFVLAAIFGWLLFGDATAILTPKIYGPGATP